MEKTTITEKVNAIAFATLTEEEFDFLKERALKSVRPSKAAKGESAKKKAEREKLESAVLEVLENVEESLTATEIGDKLGGLSSQKMTPALAKMVAAGLLVSEKAGRKTVYSKL